MKIFILICFLFISPIELRLHNDDIYQLDDLLKKYDRYNYRPNKPYISDDNNDDNDDNDDEYIPSSYQHKKIYPSHKKILNENDETENEYLLPKITSNYDLSDRSSCFNGYNTGSEQLVKIKELKNGAHMIRYTLIDKRSLESNHNIKDNCMLECCSDKSCDLAMLSEQPTHEGYKCYLFACNGSCTLASHQDYSILTPKKNSIFYTTLLSTKISIISTTTATTTPSTAMIYQKRSLLRETSVIIFLIFGIISTIILFVFIFRQYRASHKHGRKSNKNYSVDADYLINGLYL